MFIVPETWLQYRLIIQHIQLTIYMVQLNADIGVGFSYRGILSNFSNILGNSRKFSALHIRNCFKRIFETLDIF